MAGATRRPQSISDRRTDSRRGRSLPLLTTVVGGVALGATLWRIDGPPRLPARAADWARVREALSGSRLADGDVIAAAATVAWLALGYLALATGLRFLVVLADRSTGGASWTRTALRLSDLVTIPAVRRAVDGGVAGTLMLASWLPTSSRLAIAAEPAAVVAVAPPPATAPATGSPAPEYPKAVEQQTPAFVEYTVAPGDYLWDIARRFYTDGSRFVEIFEANRDRPMTEGERFSDPRVIRPGWVLRIPLPAPHLAVEGDAITYRVREGDHLWGIAERLLGDGFRWVEIWERNQGRELSAGRWLTDANLILPGWVLELRIARAETARAVPTPQPAQPSAPSVPTVATASATPLASATAAHAPRTEQQVASDESKRGAGWEWQWEWPSVPRSVLVTAAGFAVIGGTAVFVQRLSRNGRLRLSSGGDAREGPGDAGRVMLATRALARALADYGFGESAPLKVRESRRRLEFTVRCPVGDAEALIAHRHDLERRLACDIEADVVGATRVALTLSGFQRLAGLLGDEAEGVAPALVVPVGANEGGIVYLNLAATGSVAVVGSDGERRQLLRSWLATVSSTHAPQELSVRLDAAVDQLLGEQESLPHTGGATPADTPDIASELAEMIRSRSAGSSDRPVLALTAAADDVSLDEVLRDGPRAGVFVIAAISAGDVAARGAEFGASVVFDDPYASSNMDGGNGVASGAIALTVGREQPIFLDPVIVRRDTSTRWGVSAEEGRPDPFAWSPDRPDASSSPPNAVLAEATDLFDDSELQSQIGNDADEQAPRGVLRTEAETQGWGQEPGADHQDLGVSEPPSFDAANNVAAAPTSSSVMAPVRERTPAIPAGPPVATRQAALFTLPRPDAEASVTAPLFSVRCLGHFEIRARGTPIDRWPLEKSRELLAYLVAHGGASVAREVVAEALWPGYSWDASLKHTLSNTASTLRSTLRAATGDDNLQPLIAVRQRFQLPTALFDVDLDSVDASLRRAASLPDAEALDEYERALNLYSGDFLEGEFFTWLDSYRLDYRQRLIEAARRAATIALHGGDVARATAFYQAIFGREPTDEDAARGLIRCFTATGDVNGSRKVFKALTEALRRELDDSHAGPSAETRALLSEVVQV